MSFSNQSTRQQLPYPADWVYQALIEILPDIQMTINFQDATQRRIFASTGWSLFSWGENISIDVRDIDAQHAEVFIESKPKMNINFTAGPRHKKNFARIFEALHQKLQHARVSHIT